MNAVYEPQSDSEQFLTFLLGGEEYGVTILRVQGIQGWNQATTIPNTPSFILGVINLRGTIVPIIDLRRRFGLPGVPFGPTTVVIVVKIAGPRQDRTAGLVVDAVSEVVKIAPDDRRPPPDFGTGVQTDFIDGLATIEGRMVILLNLDRLVGEGLLGEMTAPEPGPAGSAA